MLGRRRRRLPESLLFARPIMICFDVQSFEARRMLLCSGEESGRHSIFEVLA